MSSSESPSRIDKQKKKLDSQQRPKYDEHSENGKLRHMLRQKIALDDNIMNKFETEINGGSLDKRL